MLTHPDVCPACNTKPYPVGRACDHCGYVGQKLDSIQRLKIFPVWMMLPVMLITCLLAVVIFFYVITG
ncbi:hypothetical protein [Yoonia sp. 208BN28-4]|uniref:hypothetical protein n=1 Tax=Yoonia sp. 208BN28-4 TaxID=3126505 RepID=UPI0030B4DD00